jgi:hypothetical protein
MGCSWSQKLAGNHRTSRSHPRIWDDKPLAPPVNTWDRDPASEAKGCANGLIISAILIGLVYLLWRIIIR